MHYFRHYFGLDLQAGAPPPEQEDTQNREKFYLYSLLHGWQVENANPVYCACISLSTHVWDAVQCTEAGDDT